MLYDKYGILSYIYSRVPNTCFIDRELLSDLKIPIKYIFIFKTHIILISLNNYAIFSLTLLVEYLYLEKAIGEAFVWAWGKRMYSRLRDASVSCFFFFNASLSSNQLSSCQYYNRGWMKRTPPKGSGYNFVGL